MRLRDKVILVTGASGIAAAGARRFASEGASVFVVSLDPAECERLVSDLPDSAWLAADLTDEGQAEHAIGEAWDRLGRIDGLFSVAGGSGRKHGDGPIQEIPLQGWETTLRLNLTTTFLAVREVVKTMRATSAKGSILMVSSVLATHPSPGLFATHAYAAAKGAQVSLTTALAAYYADDGIRFNTISPGVVDTPMARRALQDAETIAYVRRKQPLSKGPLQPDDVAAAAVYFLGDESRHVTGQNLSVDGGWTVSAG